jgi:predicted transcriptional regulator
VKSIKPMTAKSQIFYEILTYLIEHPEAQDTMEGIVEWWLLEQPIKRQTTRVKTALAELVAMGLVLERQGQDGRVHYRTDRRKAAKIRRLLSERQKRPLRRSLRLITPLAKQGDQDVKAVPGSRGEN